MGVRNSPLHALHSCLKSVNVFYFSIDCDSPLSKGDIVQSCVDRTRLAVLEALKHKGP